MRMAGSQAVASIARLPVRGICVSVGPPLSASASRAGSTSRTVPTGLQPGVLSTMLVPWNVGVPEQSRPDSALLSAMMELLTMKVPPTRNTPPPFELPELLAVISEYAMLTEALLAMPPPPPAELPFTVELRTVAVPALNNPPPLPDDVLPDSVPRSIVRVPEL